MVLRSTLLELVEAVSDYAKTDTETWLRSCIW